MLAAQVALYFVVGVGDKVLCPTVGRSYCLRMVLAILLFLASLAAGSPTCPCSVDEFEMLTCEENTVQRIPSDFRLESCGIDPEDFWAISLYDQPDLTTLSDEAFSDFPALQAIDIGYI